jgi:hypothetical protein
MLSLSFIAEPVLVAAGDRVAKQLPATKGIEEEIEWDDVGIAGEEDEFLVHWKAQVLLRLW